MFEITPNDISLLNDEQLRAVVARLCEAELLGRGYSAVYVTWGGSQNAADGGIDVRVALPPGTVIDGYVPRAATGYQVKQQDMPAGEITDEMLPKGVISRRYRIGEPVRRVHHRELTRVASGYRTDEPT